MKGCYRLDSMVELPVDWSKAEPIHTSSAELSLCTSYSELYALLGRPDPDEQERLFQAGIDSGCFTINEIRERRGLPPREGGDVPFIPNREPDEPVIVQSGGSS